MDCYKWELEAIIEGLRLKSVDDREHLAELAINMRYTLNSKKVKLKSMFDKKKEENKIIYNKEDKEDKIDLVSRIGKANKYFMNKKVVKK